MLFLSILKWYNLSSLLFGMGSSFLPAQQLALRVGMSWHRGNVFFSSHAPTTVTFGAVVSTNCYYFAPAFTTLAYSFWWRLWMPPSLRLAWCHLSGLWFLPWGDAIAKNIHGIRNVLLTVWRFLFTNVCVMLAWQCAIFLPVPLLPLKRCHHRIAGNRCPGTSSWLCPSKQMVISDKSLEVSLSVFDLDSSMPTALIASGTPRLQAGTVPAGWHAVTGIERKKSQKMDRK